MSGLAVLSIGRKIISLVLQRLGCEIGHSHLSGAEIKKCEEEHFYFALIRHGVAHN